MKFNEQIDKALRVATTAHRNQVRKGGDIPYIMHPFAVMTIAGEVTNDDDVLTACLLHDVLEDVPEEYSREQMLKEFGGNVLNIIEGVTKDNTLPSWKDRADAYLKHLEEQASDESVLVSCADKIHNLMSILEDYKEQGDELWTRFNSGKSDQLWWYKSVLEVVKKRLPDLVLVKDFENLIQKLEKALTT
jgi:(p)ppGpp synthase/HD superfamily hydrolase